MGAEESAFGAEQGCPVGSVSVSEEGRACRGEVGAVSGIAGSDRGTGRGKSADFAGGYAGEGGESGD